MPNPITKIHADWLSLIEISGPFVSMPILAQFFSHELEKEIESVDKRYADPQPRLFPVAVTFLVPEKFSA